MKKLRELLGLRRLDGSVGIEIEVEGENLRMIDSPTWKTEDDGSLRGSYPEQRSEYVLKRPIAIRNVRESVDELVEHQKDAELKFSFRCSVHVHINVSELTESQFLAFLYLSILLEEPLMNFCGEGRKANRFCLRIADAEGYLEDLIPVFQHGHAALARINPNNLRYAAINIASVPKYGSLEFRGMRGTLDPNLITTWAQTLYRLREIAKKLGDPQAVHDMFISMDNKAFAVKCLGKSADQFDVDNSDNSMNRSFSLSIDLPHQFNKFIELQKDKERILEEYLRRDDVNPVPPRMKPFKLGLQDPQPMANPVEQRLLDELMRNAVVRVRRDPDVNVQDIEGEMIRGAMAYGEPNGYIVNHLRDEIEPEELQ